MNMRVTWNPWHGCHKVSTGCKNCYMMELDRIKGLDGTKVYKVKTQFDLPLQKNRDNTYKIVPGSLVMTSMTSDFFISEADEWREIVWEIIYKRKDLAFMILTKRPERVIDTLPYWWGDGLDNIILMVSVENQKSANNRIATLLELPFKHRGIMAAPLLEEIHLERYLDTTKIEWVTAAGENYGNSRICDHTWIQSLYNQCKSRNIRFEFFETGEKFRKDGKLYKIAKENQKLQAIKSGLNFLGQDIDFKLQSEDKQLTIENW